MAKKPVKVTIAYCAECGYEPQTLELANALMRKFLYDISSIEIIPWHDGSFDVSVGGQMVHSMMCPWGTSWFAMRVWSSGAGSGEPGTIRTATFLLRNSP